jgi:hypothetical protein
VAQKSSRKVLHIPLDTLLPVDEEVYNILHGFKSGVECKNYLMNAVLYYSRSPLVAAENALVRSLSQFRFVDSFSSVCEKLDSILLEIKSFQTLASGASPVQGSGVGLAEEGSIASGSFLDESTKTALVSLRQSFKV